MLVAFTDAKSLKSTIATDSGQSVDKRVKILIAQIKEMAGVSHFEDDGDMRVMLVDTSQMLAGVLTKVKCESKPILYAMSTAFPEAAAIQRG